MNSQNFKCPKCQFDLGLDATAAGQTVYCPQCGAKVLLPSPVAIETPTGGTAPQTSPPASSIRSRAAGAKSLAGRIVAGICGGFVLASLGANGFGLLIGDVTTTDGVAAAVGLSAIVFVILWVVAIILSVKASRPAKAWRRLLIPSGLLAFALPLAMFFMTARVSSDLASKGAQLEATLMSGLGVTGSLLVGVFGFFAGMILLVIGLLVGRDGRTNCEQKQ